MLVLEGPGLPDRLALWGQPACGLAIGRIGVFEPEVGLWGRLVDRHRTGVVSRPVTPSLGGGDVGLRYDVLLSELVRSCRA